VREAHVLEISLAGRPGMLEEEPIDESRHEKPECCRRFEADLRMM
jgi:hypothetical protein